MDKNLYNYFLDLVLSENEYAVLKHETADSFVLNLISKHGMAYIEFYKDIIYGTIEYDDIYHVWEIFPNEQDMRHTAKKLKTLLGNNA
jgi:hypothetical protein